MSDEAKREGDAIDVIASLLDPCDDVRAEARGVVMGMGLIWYGMPREMRAAYLAALPELAPVAFALDLDAAGLIENLIAVRTSRPAL